MLPLTHPISLTDGTITTEIPLPANTDIFISIANSNRNPRIWGTDADEWRPERWLRPLPESVAEARIPGVYSSMSVTTLHSIHHSFDKSFQVEFLGWSSIVHASCPLFLPRLDTLTTLALVDSNLQSLKSVRLFRRCNVYFQLTVRLI